MVSKNLSVCENFDPNYISPLLNSFIFQSLTSDLVYTIRGTLAIQTLAAEGAVVCLFQVAKAPKFAYDSTLPKNT